MKKAKEEQELLASIEDGEWRRVPNYKNEVKRYRKYAKATVRKRAGEE